MSDPENSTIEKKTIPRETINDGMMCVIILFIIIIILILMIPGKGVVCPSQRVCPPCVIPPPENADEYMRVIYNGFVGVRNSQSWGLSLATVIIVSIFLFCWVSDRFISWSLYTRRDNKSYISKYSKE